MKSPNPILAEILRGHTVESLHRGAFAIVNSSGLIVQQLGDIAKPIFPRSAVKAFQCVPLIESGAADRFGFEDEHIALACSSHSGEAEHLRVAAEMLAKIGCDETDYECGSQWPERMDDKAQLIKASQGPRAIHNNCSGKHAGMLAYAKHMGVAFNDYVSIVHPVQKAVAKVIESYCDVDVSQAPHGIDGCSVPTWALPLQNTAIGFARLFASENAVGTRIARAVRNNPFLVAGTGRFDTNIMNAVPRLFIKVGAEGVFCGAIPHADLGFALKIDDGAVRGAEVSIARVLAQLNCWTNEELNALEPFTYSTLRNWRKLEVGATQSSF